MTALRPAVVISLRESSVPKTADVVHAANFVDLGRGDRLLVGDDGQGFQSRQRELERLV